MARAKTGEGLEDDRSTDDQHASGRSTNDRSIDIEQKGDISAILAPGGEKRQSLKGFDEDYTDIVDYILRCTHKIWEEKAMGLIYTHYRHNVVVHTPYGMSYGREQVVADSIQHLAAFPDRKLYGDEVIWSGNDEEGFHTSHRIVTVAHNTGHGPYGPPTGKRVVYRTIANCLVKENRIVEEWLVRDGLSLVRQLGLDGLEVARTLSRREAARGETPRYNYGEVERGKGQQPPEALPPKRSAGFDIEDFVRRSLHDLWNRRLLNVAYEVYAPSYVAYVPSGRTLYGADDMITFVLSLLAAFPDSKLSVDHLYWLGDDARGYRVATRWSLVGTHTGYGVYGEPTGERVQIMGITHHLVRGGRFVKEWTVFDELALLKQLLAKADVKRLEG